MSSSVSVLAGAGKTTLLDVIAGRKTAGTITGDIMVNGVPKQDEPFRRIVGYVEQMDIHDPFTTVREGLIFAAKLVSACCQRGCQNASSWCNRTLSRSTGSCTGDISLRRKSFTESDVARHVSLLT